MNRIDRLSAILIHLQSRRVVKAQDIADRFKTSLRTVYRDIRALEEAGVPVGGEAGRGYSLMEGYRLPPVQFTREEATAFLTAEKLVEKMTDESSRSSYSSAMYKIKAVLRTVEKDFLEHIDDHIKVLHGNPHLISGTDRHFQNILKSIAEKKVLTLRYQAQYKKETERCVEPVGVFYMGSYWHLVAFCRMRNDYRDFRLDRIMRMSVSDDTFSQQHPPLQDYLDRLYKERDVQKVVLMVKKEAVPFLGEQRFYNGFISETDRGEEVEMTFLSASLEGFARWYMMFGDYATILQPDTLKERVRHIAHTLTERL